MKVKERKGGEAEKYPKIILEKKNQIPRGSGQPRGIN